MNTYFAPILFLISVLSLLVAAGCCCTETLDVTVGVDPVLNTTLSTKVKFLTPAQCEVQKQIKRVMKEFVDRALECETDLQPITCRTRINEEYRPTIDRLLEINEKVSSRGQADVQSERLIEEAEQRASEYVSRGR